MAGGRSRTVLALTLGIGVAGADQPSKFDRHLRRHLSAATDDAPLSVIITVRPGARRGLVQKLLAHGATVNELGLIEATAGRLPAGLLRRLEKDKDVVAISTDAPVRASGITSAVTGVAKLTPFSLRATLGLTASPTYTGNGVTVAVIDSGIHKTSDFGTRIVGSFDFTKGGVAVTPSDSYGHGTAVASVIGGASTHDASLSGVATNVKFVSLRVLGADGSGTTSNVVSALQWAVANRATYKIDIINLSLGHPIYEPAATDPLVKAVESAVRAGIVVVVAAGNVGINPSTGLPAYGGILSPANAPSAITVGAANDQQTTRRTDDTIAPFSSRGPTWYDAYAKPDLVAPGRLVTSAMPPSATCFP